MSHLQSHVQCFVREGTLFGVVVDWTIWICPIGYMLAPVNLEPLGVKHFRFPAHGMGYYSWGLVAKTAADYVR